MSLYIYKIKHTCVKQVSHMALLYNRWCSIVLRALHLIERCECKSNFVGNFLHDFQIRHKQISVHRSPRKPHAKCDLFRLSCWAMTSNGLGMLHWEGCHTDWQTPDVTLQLPQRNWFRKHNHVIQTWDNLILKAYWIGDSELLVIIVCAYRNNMNELH